MRRAVFFCALTIFTGLSPMPASAGGSLLVGGPHFGHDGQPFTWNPASMPIQYRVDPGPMAVNPGGGTSDEFRKMIDADIESYVQVVKAANLKFEQ